MELAFFIQNLFTEGKVLVTDNFHVFTENDLRETNSILHAFYLEDQLEMPGTAPDYDGDAACWAAQFFYQAVQLTVLREAGEEIIIEKLKPFHKRITPAVIYSADLIFRYLPSLFELAKGLAPADLLVKELQKTANAWPFSSVGIQLEEAADESSIFSHPSLTRMYADRIIEAKDRKRAANERVKNLILETTGEYTQTIWPDFETSLKAP